MAHMMEKAYENLNTVMMLSNMQAAWSAAVQRGPPDYRVLVDLEVLLYSLGNHRGIVTDITEDGWKTQVWMLSGDLAGQEIWTYTADVAPVQPTDLSELGTGLVKLVSGPFVGRVGKLMDIVRTEEKGVKGVIEFGDGDIRIFDMSFISVAHVPRAPRKGDSKAGKRIA